MTPTRPNSHVGIRRAIPSRHAAMLVMALFCIVLTTALAVVIMTNTTQLVRITQHEHEEIVLRQMIDSGKEWMSAQAASTQASPMTLPVSAIVPENMSGEVRIDRDSKDPNLVVVIAILRNSTHEARRTARFRMAP